MGHEPWSSQDLFIMSLRDDLQDIKIKLGIVVYVILIIWHMQYVA